MTTQPSHAIASARARPAIASAARFRQFAALGRLRLEAAIDPKACRKPSEPDAPTGASEDSRPKPNPASSAEIGKDERSPISGAPKPHAALPKPPLAPTRSAAAVDRAIALAKLGEGPICLFVRLADETGAMAKDLVLAQWQDIALGQAVPTWTFVDTATGLPVVVHLSAEACAALEELRARASPTNPRVFHWLRNTLHAVELFGCFVRKHRLGPMNLSDIRRAHGSRHPRAWEIPIQHSRDRLTQGAHQ